MQTVAWHHLIFAQDIRLLKYNWTSSWLGLPESHPLHLKPLIYVQWFWFPTQINPDIEMYTISHSLDAKGKRRGEIVELALVSQRIQLVPKLGARVPANLTLNSSLEIDNYTYFLHSFLEKQNYQSIY